MKQNKKGFTLIELLAVIVILAIIALIATPIVLNMINQARKSAARSSSLGFIDSIEYYAGFRQAQDESIQLGYDVDVPTKSSGTAPDITYSNVTCTKASDAWSGDENSTATCAAFMAAVEEKSKGKAPANGSSVILNSAGKVQNGSEFKYNDKTCTYNNGDVSCN